MRMQSADGAHLHARWHDGVPVRSGRQATRREAGLTAVSRAAGEAAGVTPREHPRGAPKQRIPRADMHAATAAPGQAPGQGTAGATR